MKVIFEQVNKADARKLVSWWNEHTKWYHYYQKNPIGKLYKIIRQ